ncbi:unnamed protein product [Rodentolepis nana]|uniref:CADG domain-containing protein n=1 Tax=Rodentolepis nana TaxID=102285 RepID=A0A0R3T4R1_RODNA|nr:unnamed protein product [Rodentolepis nana]
MAPNPFDASYHLSKPALVCLSLFVAVCVLCFLAFILTLVRQKLIAKTKISKSFMRRFSYDTFDSQTPTPSILLDEQFVQPSNSSCRSLKNLSPIHEAHSENLWILDLFLRRHSAPKSSQQFRRPSEKRFLYRSVNSNIQFSRSVANYPTLHLSISYIHTVELLRIVIDKVTGLSKGDPTPKIYTLGLRIMSRSPTSAYLSKPLVTPAIAGYPTFDHLFEYTVSLKQLEHARIEATLFARPWSDILSTGRRYTVGAIPYTTVGTHGKAGVEINDLLKQYSVVGRSELVLDTSLLKNNPEVMENMSLPLNTIVDEPIEIKESEKE